MIDTAPKFDEDYFKEYFRRQRARALGNETPEAPKTLQVEGCEYSQPSQDLTVLRECALCNVKCGEQGWRHNYLKCDLRKRALREKPE